MDTERLVEQAVPIGWLVGWSVGRLVGKRGGCAERKRMYLWGGDWCDMIVVVGWGRRWGLSMVAIERCDERWMDAGDGDPNKRAGDKEDDR